MPRLFAGHPAAQWTVLAPELDGRRRAGPL